ncbi:MAG TPA: hypothetical protein VF074_15900 [Pyrinomonadaceae bacterium]
MYLVRLTGHVLSLALILSTITLLNPHVTGQRRSREEALREAGKLATEAERTMGEARKKLQPGGDHKPVLEAQRAAAEHFEKAIELWREAGDNNRLAAGIEELTRIYSVIGDYARVLDRLTREADYWHQTGNLSQHAQTLYTLGIRQMQMQREAAAIETLERVVELSRTARLRSLEPNVLTQLSFVYEKAGRLKDAATARERANKLWSMPNPEPTRVANPVPPAAVPVQWIDLPNAPAAAEYREVDGVNQAVLVNRSTKGIEMAMFGCVALDDNKKARVLHGLIGLGQNHGGVRPGFYYQPFSALNGPLNRWTDEKMGCEGAAKMTLIEAHFDDNTTWKADGIAWIP